MPVLLRRLESLYVELLNEHRACGGLAVAA